MLKAYPRLPLLKTVFITSRMHFRRERGHRKTQKENILNREHRALTLLVGQMSLSLERGSEGSQRPRASQQLPMNWPVYVLLESTVNICLHVYHDTQGPSRKRSRIEVHYYKGVYWEKRGIGSKEACPRDDVLALAKKTAQKLGHDITQEVQHHTSSALQGCLSWAGSLGGRGLGVWCQSQS